MNRDDKVVLGVLAAGALFLGSYFFMNKDNISRKKPYSSAGLVQIVSAVEEYSAPSAGLNKITSAVKEYSAESTEEAPIDIPKKVSDLETRINNTNKRIDELDEKLKGVVKTEDLEKIKTEYTELISGLDDKYDKKAQELETKINTESNKLTQYQTENNTAHTNIETNYKAGDAKIAGDAEAGHQDSLTKITEAEGRMNGRIDETNTRLTTAETRLTEVDNREQKHYEELKKENADLDGYISILDEQQKKTREDLDKERKENLKNPIHLAGRGLGFVLIDVPCGIFNGIGKGLDELGKAFKPKHEKKVSDTLCNK